MDKNNKIFIAASLANGGCFSMVLPILAPLVRQMKMTELQGGALISAGALLMAIGAIYISRQRNKYSIYRLLSVGFIGITLTWGIFTVVLAYGLEYHLAAMLLFTFLLLARASMGVFMAMPIIALQTYVMTKYTAEQQRSQTMSKFGALNSAGLVLGPFLTTLLLAWGMLTPLWVAFIIFALISLYIVLKFDRQDADFYSISEQAIPAENPVFTNKEEFSLRNSIGWFVLGFSLYIAIVTLNLTAGFYIQDQFQISTRQSAIYFAQCSLIVGISLVIMQTAISKFLQWSVQRLLWIGLVFMVLGLLISIYTTHIHIFQSAYILYGVAVACLTPAFTTGAAQSAPQHLQAKVASFCTATQALSFVFGPLVSTGLYQWHSNYPFYLLMIMFMLLAFYFLCYQKRRQSSSVPV
ncbi:MFS transporter [Acinetobacter bouvetii]|uniref:Major Facilitator Superfamily protein n=1 Tax=Acinetobacter bouvetii TaxID=202951 RepID=A0A811GJ36_9GAMM|nr:MFS transporter [Acinetobacter bouvetii]CAB1223042.1 Major Facilitator Superfamily protein [Acinetobacter bouvetii]